MPRNKYLTEEEKTKIKAWRDPSNPVLPSMSEIGRRLGRSVNVISNFIKKGDGYGVKPATKGNQKLSNRDRNRILIEAKTNRLNATEIREKLQLPVTPQHIGLVLRKSGEVKWRKPLKKPLLKPHHRVARLNFSKNHMTWSREWDQVIFSDEKKFNLDGPDCCSYYWHALGAKEDPKPSRNFGGGSVMIWGAFSVRGTAQLCFVAPRTNATRYTEMLEDALIPYLEDVMDEGAIFQQDNASIHTARVTKAWLSSRDIQVLEWAACSPDLNPIENLWAILARRVYGKPSEKRVFLTISALKHKILEEWGKIEADLLCSLARSMPNRIFEVIHNNGGPTKY